MNGRRQRFLALLGELVLALLLLDWVHGRLDIPPAEIPDFGWPDALHYSLGGAGLARGEGYTLAVNGERLPPKFPPAASLLMAPAIALAGGERTAGLHAIHLLAGLVGLLAWAAGRRLGGPAAGLAALLASQAGFCLTAYRNMMVSELPALAAALGLVWIAAPPRPGPLRLLGAGCLAGLGPAIRYPLVAAWPALLLLLGPGRPGLARRAGLLAAGAGPPLLALMAWQWGSFGSPFRTGYSLWLPEYHEGARAVFSLDYALHGPALGATPAPNLTRYLELLAGAGRFLFPWPVAAAAGLGLLVLLLDRREQAEEGRRFALAALSVTAAHLGLYAFYFYQEERLLLAAAPLAAVLGAAGLARGARGLAARLGLPGERAAGVLAPLLLVFPAASTIEGLSVQPEHVWLIGRNQPDTPAAVELARILPASALLLSGRDLLFLSSALPGRTVLPLDAGHEWPRALAWRDWREGRAAGRPGEEFAAWYLRLGREPLPAAEAARLLAPPLPGAAAFVAAEAARGRPVCLDRRDPDPAARALAALPGLAARPFPAGPAWLSLLTPLSGEGR